MQDFRVSPQAEDQQRTGSSSLALETYLSLQRRFYENVPEIHTRSPVKGQSPVKPDRG